MTWAGNRLAETAAPTRTQAVRAVAARVLSGVMQGASLTRLLDEQASAVRTADRALLAELCYGSCRRFHQLQAIVDLLLAKPLRQRDQVVHALLIIGLYQLAFMRIKPHAVVAETVNAAKQLKKDRLAGLVNGVLRRFQREQDQLMERVEKVPAIAASMPDWLYQQLCQAWPNDCQAVTEALLQPAPMTLRLNTRRLPLAEYQQQLQAAGLSATPVQELPGALVLERAVEVGQLPGFAEGLVSVQDAGAQLAAILLDPQPGEHVLDACAAPGGKTGHLLERAESLELTAVDIDAQRLARVNDNLQRLGLEATLAVADVGSDAGDWYEQQYEAILLDVPCSATGVIRRHPDIKLLRQPTDIAALAGRQRQILKHVWARLRPGGRLLYVTCSLLPAENEQQVAAFLTSTPDARALPIDVPVNARRGDYGVQLLPGISGSDGFYYALLHKTEHAAG